MPSPDTVTYYLDDSFASRDARSANGTLVILASDGEPVALPARMLSGPDGAVRISARVPWSTYWARYGRSHPSACRTKTEYRRRNRS